MKNKRYELCSTAVEEFRSGPREGQRKPISLPADAIPLGIKQGFATTRINYLVPLPRPS